MKTLQRIGKSLLVPVSVLPAAALLLGIGYAIANTDAATSNEVIAFISNLLIQSGDGILGNIGFIFAVGVGFGMSKDNTGGAALSAIVLWLVVIKITKDASIHSYIIEGIYGKEQIAEGSGYLLSFTKVENTLIGILVGCTSAFLYNRTYKTELPAAFAFFSGRRLSPIVCSFVAVPFALLTIIVWPPVFNALLVFGKQISELESVGAGLFGFANRLLIPTGLHHALNQVFWFDVAGINDIPNFLSSEAGNGVVRGVTGRYQAGFFPIMMFGLPAAALAMYHTVDKARRNKVVGIFSAAIITAVVTGVTEPIEFMFIFTAPPLLIVHAVLTGLSMYIASSMQWIAGFGFSAGAIDFILSISNPLSKNIFMLFVQGLIFAPAYYFIFKFAILKFNFKTYGRDENDFKNIENAEVSSNSELAQKIVNIIGIDNFDTIDNCATRLRLELRNVTDEMIAELKTLPVLGVVKTAAKSVQVVIGPKVQFITDDVKAIVENGPVSTPTVEKASSYLYSIGEGTVSDLSTCHDPVFAGKMVGDGYLFTPSTDELFSPVSGTITMMAEQNHAIGITTEEGYEVLVHVGIESVGLTERQIFFEGSVGDKINVGDKLAKINLENLKQMLPSIQTPVLITNVDKPEMKIIVDGEVNKDTKVVEVK